MFTVFMDNHADIWERLLEFYFPRGAKVIDFTYGTGAIWWNIYEKKKSGKYPVTRTDAQPSQKDDVIFQKDLTASDYSDLGLQDCGVFDPPYLIGRPSFDYPSKGVKKLDSQISGVPMQYQGKRSWSAGGLEKYVANLTVEVFNERVRGLNQRAPTVLRDGGLLFVKVMDPRNDGKLVAHHLKITEILTNFELSDLGVYIRQGAITWKVKGHLQNLHGYWMVFQKKRNGTLA